MAKELPYQTYERIKKKKWPGGKSPEVGGLLKQYGITTAPGEAATNLALQKQMLGGVSLDLPEATKTFESIKTKADALQKQPVQATKQVAPFFIAGTPVTPDAKGGYTFDGRTFPKEYQTPASIARRVIGNVADYKPTRELVPGLSLMESPTGVPGAMVTPHRFWQVDTTKFDEKSLTDLGWYKMQNTTSGEWYWRSPTKLDGSQDTFTPSTAVRFTPSGKQAGFFGPASTGSKEGLATPGVTDAQGQPTKPTAPPITPIKPITPTEDLDVTGAVTPTIEAPAAPKILENYTTGLLADLGNKRKALDDLYSKQIKDLQTQKETLETKIAGLETKQEGVLEKDVKPLLDPFRKDLEESERKRLKLEENYFANQNSVQELETLLTGAMAEIQSAKDVTGLAAIRNPRIAKLQTDMAARVGVIEAVMAARNDQITVAENLIDRSVTAIEADRRDQLTYYESLLSFYEGKKDDAGNKLVSLSKDQKSFLEAQIGLIEGDLATSQASVDYIKGLLLDPSTAELAESAGIKLTDSIEEVNAKLAGGVAKQNKTDIINSMALEGFKHLALPAQYAGKPEGELTRVTDSQGNEMVFWKKTELKKEDLLSVSEAEKLGVAYGITRAEAASRDLTAVATPSAAERGAEEDVAEITRVENELTNFGERDFVSEGYYNQVKATSTLGPTEFDNRFEYLLKEGVVDDFTSTENRKLEQAGLSDASRQEKLNHLYGDDADDFFKGL